MSAHENIERYCRLLATELTDLERQYLHKRIAEQYAQLERLEKGASRAKIFRLRSVVLIGSAVVHAGFGTGCGSLTRGTDDCCQNQSCPVRIRLKWLVS